jgi:hypothetical protein
LNKKLITLLLLAGGLLASPSFADEHNSGYVYTAYGELVKGAYGHCIHTAYFDADDGLAECGEAANDNNDYSGG